MKQKVARYYIFALLVIIVWSSTFISTKVLLSAFTPVEILVYRFTLAYLLLFIVYPHVHRPESLKTELKLFFAGITGGSAYFLAENFALSYSYASNVALLVSTAPIITAVLAHFLLKGEGIRRRACVGAVIAFSGAALVILNGKFVLRLNPLGDLLAIASALSWAIYSVIVRDLDTKYSSYYITRKIFFYTLLTISPVLFLSPARFDFSPLLDIRLSANLLFLAVFASCGAYVVWNRVIWSLGATKANNLIYFIPLLTLAESVALLGEPLTPYALAGAALIFSGVYITSGRQNPGTKDKSPQ